MVQNNLICVHHGSLYGPEYVLNLWRGARRNSKQGFNFYVFTDNIAQHPQNLGWHFVKLPTWHVSGLKPWWYKLEIFSHQYQLEGNNLYLDIDTVIVNNIDEFWNYYPDEFKICQDFNRAFSPAINLSNSSVMAWNSNSMSWLYKRYTENMQHTVHKYRGDQDFIHAETVNGQQRWWPTDWAMSWKWEIKHGGKLDPAAKYRDITTPYIINRDTKIVVCHGKPDPHEIPELDHLWNK
jgi:hypothetical protein